MKDQKNNRAVTDRNRLKKILSIGIMGTICLTAAVSVASLSKTVTVTDGDKTMTINTISADTESILRKTGVSLGENDKLVRTDDSGSEISISILRAANVDKTEKEVSFSETSVAEALFTSGMTMSGDEPASLAAIETSDVETEIKLKRYNVEINLRGELLSKEVPAGTVKEALEYLDIELDKNDIINVDIKSAVEEDMKIEIKNVAYEMVTSIETIDYDTVYEDTDQLYVGETSVKTAGVEGQRTIVTKKKLVNGEVESEETVSDTVTAKPVDQVVYKGTAPKVNNVYTHAGTVTVNESAKTLTDTHGNTVSYSYALTGSGTAYYAPAGSLTATGRLARYGVVAVNPNVIPYGSILYIVSNDGQIVYGYAVAGDTGGGLMDNLILVDLFYPTYDECCVFGRRDVTIYILEYGNEFR